jgi:RNA polymerase sigma-32 factor
MDWLVDDSASQESRLAETEHSEKRHKALGQALNVLNDRERRIFEARRLADEPITLEELADEFGVSRERVRQIEVRAFEKVQKTVMHCIAETTKGIRSRDDSFFAAGRRQIFDASEREAA